MDIDLLRGVGTVLCIVGFAAVVVWAYSPRHKSRFEEDGRLPFADDSDDPDEVGEKK
ncbi:MAG: cytochrome c oxidase cbb3-type subunit 4 [Sulfitobacter sp.]|jgi:cytochrome c oxidase cbb3-type subunit 4